MSRINYRRRATWKFRKPIMEKSGHAITPDSIYDRGREKTKWQREAHHEAHKK